MGLEAPPSRKAEPFISLDDVSIRLYDRVMFERTRWEILSDQHWAVVGPNGAGKSTLMRAVCGQIPIVEGRIVYHFWGNGGSGGNSLRGGLPQDRIAYVSFDTQRTMLGHEKTFHQARWHSDRAADALSVSEYLSEDQVWRVNPYQVVEGEPDAAVFRARRDNVIGLVEVEALLERSMIHLSNGERRKTLIAQALLRDPQLLILDNPFTGLDGHFRIKLMRILERLMQGDMRVVVVSTEQDEVPAGVTHVLRVENGRIATLGPLPVVLEGGSKDRMIQPDRSKVPGMESTSGRRSEAREAKDRVLVRMDSVKVSYNGVIVLDGIDWMVQRGENWALLGPNGSGKTTLLSLILGDNPQAYANDITLFGRRRGSGESIWEIKKRIGWVASELHLYYPSTVPCFDVVCSGFFDSIGLYRRCSSEQCKTARMWMERLGITARADAMFGRISEGEQRMVLLARALVKHPWLLVLDEPCQGLDRDNRDRVLQTIDAIAGHLDTSVIYVTHRSDELPGAITHVMKLGEGRIVNRARIGDNRTY
jgi:molybdate transport system ATP-binding protein